jgi:hypothetical protein
MPKNINIQEAYQYLFQSIFPQQNISVVGISNGDLVLEVPEAFHQEFVETMHNPVQLREKVFHAIPVSSAAQYNNMNAISYNLRESDQDAIKLIQKVAAEQYLNALGLKLDAWKVIGHNQYLSKITIEVKHPDTILASLFENNIEFANNQFFAKQTIDPEIIKNRDSQYPQDFAPFDGIVQKLTSSTQDITQLELNYGQIKLALEECKADIPPIIAYKSGQIHINPKCLILYIDNVFNQLLCASNSNTDQCLPIMTNMQDQRQVAKLGLPQIHKTTLVIDKSDSMRLENRLSQTKEVIKQTVNQLLQHAKNANSECEIEFIVFSSDSEKVTFSSKDDHFLERVNNFISGIEPNGNTNLNGVLHDVLSTVQKGSNSLLVFSDGVDNIGNKILSEVTEVAEQSPEIPIFAIAIGSDLPELKQIVDAVGGTYIDARDVKNMKLLYEHLVTAHRAISVVRFDTFKEVLTSLLSVSEQEVSINSKISINGEEATISKAKPKMQEVSNGLYELSGDEDNIYKSESKTSFLENPIKYLASTKIWGGVVDILRAGATHTAEYCPNYFPNVNDATVFDCSQNQYCEKYPIVNPNLDQVAEGQCAIGYAPLLIGDSQQ